MSKNNNGPKGQHSEQEPKVDNNNRRKMPKEQAKPTGGKSGSRSRNDMVSRFSDAVSNNKQKKQGVHDHNDPAWYAKSPELLSAAAAVNWFPGAGHFLDLGIDEVDGYRYRDSIPGVMEIDYVPTIGKSVKETSAVNIAARSFFGDMRAFQSGRSNYDPTDLMFYVLAAANAYAYLAWMIRIYGTIRMYSTTNRYLPSALLRAQGVNDVAIRGKGFDLYWYIQEYRTKLSSFCFPGNMPLYDRYQFLNEAYYMDSECTEAKIYVTRPFGFYKYEEMLAPHGQLTLLPLTPNTLEDIIDYGNTLVGALSDSEDCYIMSGDILRAYQEDVFAVPTIGLDHLAPIKYDEFMLEQIHHATVWPCYMNDWSSFNITQDLMNFNSPTIICDPELHAMPIRSCDPDLACARRLLSAPELPPKPEKVIEMTRLMSYADPNTAEISESSRDPVPGWTSWKLSSFGTEIVIGARVWSFKRVGDIWTLFPTGVTALSIATRVAFNGADAHQVQNIFTDTQLAEAASRFKKHPLIATVFADTSETVEPNCAYFLWDTDNYTVVDEPQIDKMHETALLSLLDVPTMGLGKFPKKPNA